MKELGMARSVFTASAVAVALALAGCGGGGDSDDRADRADAAVAGLEAQIADLEGQVGDLDTQVTALTGERDTAQTRVTELEGMIGDEMNPAPDSLRGMVAQANSDLEQAEMDLTTARNKHTTDAGTISGLETQVTDLTNERDRIQGMLNAANMELDGDGTTEGLRDKVVRLEAAAAALEDRKQVDAAKLVNAALRAEGTRGDAPAVSVSASVDGMMTSEATGYEDSGTDEDVSGMPEGWRGRMLARTGNEIYVYSNIEDAEGTPLSRLYDSSANADGDTTYNVARAAGSSVSWDHVGRPDGVRSSETVGTVTTVSFAGTARGVDGTFLCTSGTCTPPTRNSDGTVDDTGVAGDWSFIPSDPAMMASVADEDYVTVGWWLGGLSDGTQAFDAFAMVHGDTLDPKETNGDDDPYAGTGANISGDASYKGGAAGKYVFLDTILNTGFGGHWTATANLVANFDADSAGDDDPNENDEDGVTLSGSITDFVSDRGTETWTVLLNASDAQATQGGIQGHENVAEANSGASAWTLGPDAAAAGEGTWTAEYHGSEADNAQPGAITGGFEASIGNRAVIVGAFGGEREKKQ